MLLFSKDQIQTLSSIFNELDPNRSGDVSLTELMDAFDRDDQLEGRLAAIDLDVNEDARAFFGRVRNSDG